MKKRQMIDVRNISREDTGYIVEGRIYTPHKNEESGKWNAASKDFEIFIEEDIMDYIYEEMIIRMGATPEQIEHDSFYTSEQIRDIFASQGLLPEDM